jgi:hypothetical protein
MKPEPRIGWRLFPENLPSRVSHWMPEAQSLMHDMSHKCWCKPEIENELGPPYSIVLHHEAEIFT